MSLDSHHMIRVQKYGGTSLNDLQCIERCAARATNAHANGDRVVVVVSAMGKTTDKLVQMAGELTDQPSDREMDMLLATGEQVSASLMAMAIRKLGVPAAALIGQHLGIETSPAHGRARITGVDVEHIREHLTAGHIVVAPGFQGLTPDGRVTTLGRGGSDITAVALAAALGVSKDGGACEIFTDVDGVYTAAPRIVPDARRIPRISYDEMLELASLGATVLHSRAAVFGQRYDLPIHIRHSRKPEPGTMIVMETPDMENYTVVGCALTPDLGRVSVRGLPNRPGVQAVIFDHIASAEVLVDDIMQTDAGGTADVSFTVEFGDLAETKLAVQRALEAVGQGEIAVEVGLSKVSIVGVGMRSHAGVASRMFKALGNAAINILNITTSEIKVSCIVPKEHGEDALRVVHDAFELGMPHSDDGPPAGSVELKSIKPVSEAR